MSGNYRLSPQEGSEEECYGLVADGNRTYVDVPLVRRSVSACLIDRSILEGSGTRLPRASSRSS
jgi:hypothetical protein